MTNILVNDNACNILGCCNLFILHVVFVIFLLCQGEEEENNEDDEEEDAGWMVPHGYLSEGEGCEDDEDVSQCQYKKMLPIYE